MEYFTELDHFLDEVVDLVALHAASSALIEMYELLLSREPVAGRRQLERPQEVVNFLEVWSYGEDLVDDILDAVHREASETLLHDIVGAQRHALAAHFAISTLVDKLTN